MRSATRNLATASSTDAVNASKDKMLPGGLRSTLPSEVLQQQGWETMIDCHSAA